jgi:hypothetical protein
MTAAARRGCKLAAIPDEGGSMRTRTILAATLAAAAAAAAIPTITGAQAPGPRDITLRGKVIGGHEVKHGRGEALAPGDSIVVRLAFTDEAGARVGTAYAQCTNVGTRARAERAKLQCLQTYDLRDGQIVTSGVVVFSGPDLQIPIVGGSGAYRGATGHVTTGAPVRGFDTVDVLHIAG